jgi:hypothetical protein
MFILIIIVLDDTEHFSVLYHFIVFFSLLVLHVVLDKKSSEIITLIFVFIQDYQWTSVQLGFIDDFLFGIFIFPIKTKAENK